MGKSKINIVLLFWLIISANIFAQDEISIPYECGFEDSVEITKWNLNFGPDSALCQDRWKIGNLEYSSGYNSMYISCDTGKTVTFGAKQNIVVAYRKIKFPAYLDSINKKGVSIDIAFDWKCLGEKDNIMLNFYFKSADPNRFNINNIGSTLNKGIIPRTWALGNADATLYSSRKWQTWTSPNESKFKVFGGDEFYMIFVWQNRNQDATRKEPMAISIDNIQITLRNAPRPTDLTASSYDTTIVVDWGGEALFYDLQYRLSGKKWVSMPNLKADAKQKNRVELTGLEEGFYDIRVRGRNSANPEDVSAWVTTSAICYIPDNHCIDFIHLDTSTVTCLVNDADLKTLIPTKIGKGAGPVSNGETSIGSRHQVIWSQGAFDPRTGNQLRLIPEDDFVSVRLGNWAVGGESEAIVFEYMVDTMEAKIILMKYAVVLEAPDHGPAEDPYFGLQILNENGDLLNPSCGKFDFTPTDDAVDWHKTGAFVWKDWTSIGMNVEQYHGQIIKIRLETQDCKRAGHAGYAYFNLDCVDATIKTTSCGESLNMEMVAPDGFAYTWTNRADPSVVVSTDRILSVPANDTATYDCRVEYKDKEGCGFDLSTSVYPRFPFADFEWKWIPSNCENKILLINKGLVRTKIKDEFVDLTEKIEYGYWSIDEESWYSPKMDSVVFVVDSDGDTLDVNLEVGLSGGVCAHDTTMTIIVEPIYGSLDTLYEEYCAGGFRIFNNEYLAEAGVFTEILPNRFGCDSITVLDLSFFPKIEDTYIDTTICSLDSLTLWGAVYKDSGTYEKMLKSKRGCDSVVVLNLTKIDPLGVDFPIREEVVCADEETVDFYFDSIEGFRIPEKYSINFDTLALKWGFVNQTNIDIDDVDRKVSIVLPDTCRPNIYTAEFVFSDSTSICGDISVPVKFDVYYSAKILQSKFGNLITVYDADSNGGYSFVPNEYKWYKNDSLLINETTSYLYLGDDVVFKDGDCYYIEVRRIDDGVVARSCEICPGNMGTSVEDVYDSDWLIQTTVVNKGASILLDGVDSGIVSIYSVTGVLIGSEVVDVYNSQIVAPSKTGFYIVQIKTEDRYYVYKIWVR